jgi:hypothetical protein
MTVDLPNHTISRRYGNGVPAKTANNVSGVDGLGFEILGVTIRTLPTTAAPLHTTPTYRELR